MKHGIAQDKESLQEALDQNEKLMQEASLTWEQKERQTERIHQVKEPENQPMSQVFPSSL